MDWLTAFLIFTLFSSIGLSLVVLSAMRTVRRSLLESALRQAQQMKRLVETVATLHEQQQTAEARIQVLAEANRKLNEEVTSLSDQVNCGDGRRPRGTSRLLH